MEWRDISSAPRDRRVILAKFGWALVDPKGDWDRKEWCLFFAVSGLWNEERGKWTDGLESLVPPTHWREIGKIPAPLVGPNGCAVPPAGWYCTRDAGHDGPCAALPNEGNGQ